MRSDTREINRARPSQNACTGFAPSLGTLSPRTLSPRILGTTLAALFCAAALVGCGKSSSSSSSTIPIGGNTVEIPWQAGQYAPFTQYLDYCATPRSGIDPADGKPFLDRPGSAAHEKFALRSFSHETYLWANQLADINPNYALSPQAYFDSLKTQSDRFHFYVTSEDNYRDFILSKPISYGITWLRAGETDIVAAYVERNSPAERAGIARGYKLVSIDGVAHGAMNESTRDDALFPSETNPSHRFVFKNRQGETLPELRLDAQELTVNSVQNLQFFTGANEQTIGYFSFGSFNGTAQWELIDAANSLNAQNAQELIIDLRFNGGGYLDVASELAYIVGGNPANNSMFSALRFGPNVGPTSGFKDEVIPFRSRTVQLTSSDVAGQPLPKLNLKKLYVLTSSSTCSASEALINGLRGVDFPVIQIGTTTCGKPYGMVPLSNCGYEYYTVNFRYENAKGFSAFEEGIAPKNSTQAQGSPLGCEIYDQFTHSLGNSEETLLAAAINHINTGSCPVAAATLAAPRRDHTRLLAPSPAFNNAIGPRIRF